MKILFDVYILSASLYCVFCFYTFVYFVVQAILSFSLSLSLSPLFTLSRPLLPFLLLLLFSLFFPLPRSITLSLGLYFLPLSSSSLSLSLSVSLSLSLSLPISCIYHCSNSLKSRISSYPVFTKA